MGRSRSRSMKHDDTEWWGSIPRSAPPSPSRLDIRRRCCLVADDADADVVAVVPPPSAEREATESVVVVIVIVIAGAVVVLAVAFMGLRFVPRLHLTPSFFRSAVLCQ